MSPAELQACAPYVSAVTLAAVIRVESGGNPIAIHVNRGPQPPPATTIDQAITYAAYAIARGYSVDLGLMQLNSKHLASLGYRVSDAFDPCRNIAAGARILQADYTAAAKQIGPGQGALLAALSAYNSGSFVDGFYSGYVAQYVRSPRRNSYFRVKHSTAFTYNINPNDAPMVVYSREDRVPHGTVALKSLSSNADHLSQY